MEKNGSWAGEDMIATSESYLKRDLHDYTYSDKAGVFPSVYSHLRAKLMHCQSN